MIKGERFELDLGSDDHRAVTQSGVHTPFAFIGDVLERKPVAAPEPSAPTLKNSSGFPEHKKPNVESRFKTRWAASAEPLQDVTSGSTGDISHGSPAASTARNGGDGERRSWEEDEKARIHLENRQRLADMSTGEIEEARAELMSSLSPALLQRLLARSNIDSGSNEGEVSESKRQDLEKSTKAKQSHPKTVEFAEESRKDGREEAESELDVRAAEPLPHDMHFPRTPQPPELDPNSKTFFQDLHEKYFPSLPADPDKLEWMQASFTRSAYDPSATSLNPHEIRFDFKGELLPPKTAAQIPVSAGLHHHGDAPEAAGYTIAELAHLSRSTFAAQRCIAFQTLGRILYKLGRGEFGDAGEAGANTVGAENTFGELARGLWREVEKERVIDLLVADSQGNGVDGGRHVSAKAYATEAVWLWRKGGGRRWKAE